MTVTVTNIVAGPFVATGDEQVIPFDFKVFTSEEVEVVVGADRTPIDPDGYVVTPNRAVDGQVMEGGTITLLEGSLTAGQAFNVVAKPAKTQELVFSDTGSRLRNLNEGLDRSALRALRAQYDGALEGAGDDILAAASAAGTAAGSAAGTAAVDADARITGAAQKSANLSDLADTLAARNTLRVSEYSTRTAAMAQGIVPTVSYIRTQGYASVGDDGGALYKRVGSEPAHDAKFQTADGAWWEIASKEVRPEQFGAKGDGVTDDSWPIAQAVGFADVIRFGRKTYVGIILAWRPVKLIGEGYNYTVLKDKRATGVTVDLASAPFHLEGMRVDRSVAATSGEGIRTVPGGYGTLRDVIASNHWNGITLNATAHSIATNIRSEFNYNNGLSLVTSAALEACQWKITNAILQLNDGKGVVAYAASHSTGPLQTGPVLTNVGTYGNGKGGWEWSGDGGTAWNDVNGLHCYSSFDNGPGMLWINCGANNQFVDSFIEFASMRAGGRTGQIAATKQSHGVHIFGGITRGTLSLDGLVLMRNGKSGLYNQSNIALLQLGNVQASDNGEGGTGNKAGVELDSATTRTVITNLTATCFEAVKTQAYGVYATPTAASKASVVGGAVYGNVTGASNQVPGSYGAWSGVIS